MISRDIYFSGAVNFFLIIYVSFTKCHNQNAYFFIKIWLLVYTCFQLSAEAVIGFR